MNNKQFVVIIFTTFVISAGWGWAGYSRGKLVADRWYASRPQFEIVTNPAPSKSLPPAIAMRGEPPMIVNDYKLYYAKVDKNGYRRSWGFSCIDVNQDAAEVRPNYDAPECRYEWEKHSMAH